jgi:hypothetical protein
MATYSKLTLSGSVSGRQILISGMTSGSATQIHTAVAGSSSFDEIWIYAYNDSTASLLTSVLWGATTEPNDVARFSVPSRSGRVLIVDGKLLNNGLTISAYCTASNSVVVDGFVNRIV